MRTAARARPVESTKFGILTAALLASTALVSVTTPASAVVCNAANDGAYDTCVTAFLAGDTVNVTGPATHNLNYTTGGILNVNAGGALTDTGGQWGTGLALTIATGGSLTLNGLDASGTLGFDTFASLAGSGTLTLTGGGMIFGGNNASTAFSGTVVAPTLGNFIAKIGTGTWTVDGMTMAEGDLRIAQGTLANTGGTTNIKSIGLGSGGGSNATATMSGGTLNITGNFAGGPPCVGGCPSLRIGDFGGIGVFNQSGGTVNIGALNVAASLNIGNEGGNGTYNMSSGTLNMGILGNANSAGLYSIGRSTTNANNSVGVFNISGGTVNVNAGDLINGDRDGPGNLATTSSTINLSGGTLSVRNGANLWLSAFNNAGAIDSVFNLSGTGVLEIGDGRLQANYGGGGGAYEFNLNGGQIRVIDSDLTTTVNAILLGASATAGTQINTNGLNANWNGILSGAGWIVKTGAGTLTLGGPGNTYTGGTAFNGGTVLVDALADLGAATAAMSFNGGTLRFGANNVLVGRTGNTTMAGAGTIDTAGFFSVYTGNITGSGALTVTGGGNLDLQGNNNAHTGALNISGAGTSVFANPNGVGDTSAVSLGAGTTLLVNNGAGGEVIGSLASTGAATVTINNGVLTTGGNNLSTTYTGTIGEGGPGRGLTKTGTGAFTVNGNLTYTGLTTVSAGSMLLNGSMADSLLVASGATFGGNATITGNVTNNGHIAPGNSPGTVTMLGNYTAGPGAIFDMEVQFNNAATASLPVNNGVTHDFVTMTNPLGTVTGTTLINVIAISPSDAAAATVGNGIELVRVAGTVAGNQFQLAAPVLQGAYEYLLTYRPNYSGALDGWFLTSRASEVMYGEAAMFAASQTMINSCFRSDDALTTDGGIRRSRAWAKVIQGSRDTGADTGNDAAQDYTCGAGGIDAWAGGAYRVGLSGGWGMTDVEVQTPAGVADLSGTGGMIQVNFGLQKRVFFANIGLGYGTTEWTFDGPGSAPIDATLNGFVGALQLGAMFQIGDGWNLGMIAEADYDGMECDVQCLLAGTEADPTKLFVKGTLRIDGEMNSGDVLPYAAVSISNGDTNTVKNGAVSFTTDTASSLIDAKAGLSVRVDRNMAVYVDGGITEGLSNDVSGWNGTAGFKVMW